VDFRTRAYSNGDLTPGNVLVRDDGNAAIVDFMIPDLQRLIVAPFWGEHHYRDERWKEADGRYNFTPYRTEAYGTPGSMPPEQAVRGIVFPSSDVYTLGLTFAHLFFLDFYMMHDAHRPFLVAWQSGLRGVDATARREMTDLALRGYDSIEELIACMTQTQPEDRIQTMKEVEHTVARLAQDMLAGQDSRKKEHN
jgi:serine/threonine protein kinase